MFSIDQIQEAHSKVKSGADFPKYIQDLKTLGVTYYDNFVSDGKSIFYGLDNFAVNSEAKYPQMKVADEGSKEKLQHALGVHQAGETDYLTFCKQAADAGVEKWTTDIIDGFVIYYDKAGNELIKESIPQLD